MSNKMIQKLSKYQIKNINTISIAEWHEFIDQNDYATIFHTPYMHDLYDQCSGLSSFAYFAVDAEGSIKALITGYKQDLVKIPFCTSFKRTVLMQSPIYSDIEALRVLLDYYQKKHANQIVTEIRNHYLNDEIKSVMNDLGFSFEDHLNILVNLNQSEEDLWKQIHPKRRNEIIKAQKTEIQVKLINNNELEKAYQILKDVYSRIKLPLLPIKFFKTALMKRTNDYGLDIWGAYSQHQMIGVMVVLKYKKMIYDYFAGSLSSEYNKHPNDIIPWEVFKYYHQEGYELFDFGGAGKPDIPYGVRDYKLKFGGKLVNHGRFIFIHNNWKFLLLKTALNFRKRYLNWRKK